MKPKRVLLKLSGEVLKGPQEHGIDSNSIRELGLILKSLRDTGLQLGIVIGGGNIFRGILSSKLRIHKSPADYMGMLATMINGIAIQQTLEALDCPARVISGLECPKAVESYNWNKVWQYLDNGEVVLFVGGTGNPYFTTDTAAALRASEIEADMLLKATKVDGVFDKDPVKSPDAKKYQTLSYTETLGKNLQIMDPTSIALCQSNQIPILVFNMKLLVQDKITDLQILQGKGTIIR